MTPAENQESLRLVRRLATTPLAVGEVFNTVWDFQTLIREQLIDYVGAASTPVRGYLAAEGGDGPRRPVPSTVRLPCPG